MRGIPWRAEEIQSLVGLNPKRGYFERFPVVKPADGSPFADLFSGFNESFFQIVGF